MLRNDISVVAEHLICQGAGLERAEKTTAYGLAVVLPRRDSASKAQPNEEDVIRKPQSASLHSERGASPVPRTKCSAMTEMSLRSIFLPCYAENAEGRAL